MSANAHTTVRLGDLVAGAFDWAEQCCSDPRTVPFLATKAVEHLLRRARKTMPARQASGLISLEDFGPLLAFGAAGRQTDPSTSKGAAVGR